ncbi:hypothetical protein TCAL_00677 [Tigriopus californicus]|uniref:Reelin domain-containing protein n=1 Tax=Tigriopus californicus TaxID=6832 RepID=A0A553PE00_TIGCA|nr:putative defense protein 1 [Tigriopus californicus]TRY75900.1 hypothetical protein TCAL_00677 [Tigriopus californicus]|eukprot:TCALIF_00677-PA protein Name:"Similar to Putative defense protein 1 (Lonomia obliqua)" AED:0.07 eAED:0.07 QI:0/-1/0/1/-1/1/1/0/199
MILSAIPKGLVLALSFFGFTRAYPSGAPVIACQNGIPQHGLAQPQSGRAPYEILVDENGHNHMVEIALRGLNREVFRGFLLRVVSVASGKVLGSLELDPSQSLKGQIIDCASTEDAATHINRSDKDEVKLIWNAPQGFDGQVKVVSTVVQNHQNFWTNVESAPFNVGHSGANDNSNSQVALWPSLSLTCVASAIGHYLF